jgi:hypothetical protein
MKSVYCLNNSVRPLHGDRAGVFLSVACICFFMIFTTGCGSNSSKPVTPTATAIVVSVSPTAAISIDQGQSKNFTASLTNDTATKGVTWSVSGGGALSNQTTTGVTYTAPANVAANTTVTLTATSVSDSTKSLAVTITVTPLPAVTSTSLVNATAGNAYNVTLTKSGGVAPFTWSVTSGTLPVGLSLNSASGAITGTPTTAGTSNVTFQVTDSGSPAVSATQALSITVDPVAVNDNLLSGTYALTFAGWDNNGYVAMAGSFIADGAGAISGGVLDVTSLGSLSTNIAITGGSFTVAADNRGSFTLISSLGTWAFRMSVDATGQKARFVQFDASGTRGSGLIKKQDTAQFATALAGDFAFGMTGYDDVENRTSVDGAFTAAAGNISTGSLDGSSSGTSTGQIAISGGAISAASGTAGRGTLSVNHTITGFPATTTYAYYMISASEAFFVNINPVVDSVPRFNGSLLKQNKPGGGFTAGSFNAPVVFRSSALDTSHLQTNVAIGQVVPDGLGSVTSAFLDQNADGMITTAGPSSGTYTVASSGRAVVAITGIHQEVVYLVDTNTGFLIEGTTVDPGNDVGLGFFEPQTSTAAPSGTYVVGTIDPGNDQANDVVGSFTAGAGSPPLTGTLDSSNFPSTLIPDQTFTGVYTTTVDSQGRATATITPTGGSPIPIILWVISPNKFVAIVGDAAQTETSLIVIDK